MAASISAYSMTILVALSRLSVDPPPIFGPQVHQDGIVKIGE